MEDEKLNELRRHRATLLRELTAVNLAIDVRTQELIETAAHGNGDDVLTEDDLKEFAASTRTHAATATRLWTILNSSKLANHLIKIPPLKDIRYRPGLISRHRLIQAKGVIGRGQTSEGCNALLQEWISRLEQRTPVADIVHLGEWVTLTNLHDYARTAEVDKSTASRTWFSLHSQDMQRHLNQYSRRLNIGEIGISLDSLIDAAPYLRDGCINNFGPTSAKLIADWVESLQKQR